MTAELTLRSGMFVAVHYFLQGSFSQTFLLADSFWLRKITMDPHIRAYVNIECPDDRYLKLKIYLRTNFRY